MIKWVVENFHRLQILLGLGRQPSSLYSIWVYYCETVRTLGSEYRQDSDMER